MLTIFLGANGQTPSLQKEIASEIKKGATLVRFSNSSFSENDVLNYLAPQDLFAARSVVHLSQIGGTDAGILFYQNHADKLARSDTVFIVDEEKLLKSNLDQLKKAGATIREEKTFAAKEKMYLTPFAFVDAYNTRDKKNAWVLFSQLVSAGVTAEEICGALVWNFKNLALVQADKEKSVKVLNPYVYQKTLHAAKNFSSLEIKNNTRGIVSLIHSSHRGLGESATLLELFVLRTL